MPSKEQRRIARLLGKQEASIKTAFAEFVRGSRSERTLKEIADRLQRRDVEGAMQIVDTHVARMGNVIPSIFAGAGEDEIADLQSKFGRTAIALSFDATETRAAQLIRESRLRFVRGFAQEQRRATTRALSASFMQGAGIEESARAFRASLGLSETQVAATQNYARLLSEGSREALQRTLRDRRFDRTLENAIDSNEPLEAETILRMVGRYSERLMMFRANTIARTETMQATGEARREAMSQVLEDLNIPRGDIVRVWNSTLDDKTRDSHAAMDGQEVGLDEPFTSGNGIEIMFPGDPAAPPEEIINCRCVVTNRVL